MSLFRIHGISKYPSHFLNDKHILIESGSILSCLNIENGEQNFVLTLTEFESISCIASNPYNMQFVIAIQSDIGSRIELYRFHDIDNIELFHVFGECGNVGYSHIDISNDGEYMIAISNIPDLQIEFWSIDKQKKLASTNVQSDDIKYAVFSPRSFELFMTANNNTIILWRVYYKFDQYFLTSTIHSLKQNRKIISITFGERGNEMIYCNNFGEMIIFDENTAINDYNDNIKHKFNVNQPIFKLLFTRFYYVIIFAEDGIIQFISKTNLQKIYQYHIGSSIKHCILTPNYKQLLIIDEEYELLNCFIDKKLLINNNEQFIEDPKLIQQTEICKFSQIKPNHGFNIISLQTNDCILIHTEELQLIQLNNSNHAEITENLDFPIFNVSTMEIAHYNHDIDLIAFGFNDGHFGLCHAENSENSENSTNLKLFFAERLFQNNIKQIQFDMNGTLISCISNHEKKIWFIQIEKDSMPKIIGYYKLNNIPICCCWITDAYDNIKIIIAFNNGFVATYDSPIIIDINNEYEDDDDDDDDDDNDEDDIDNDDTLLLNSFYVDCEVDFSLQKIVRDPNETSPDRLLCLTEDNKLKAFLLDDDATVFPDDTFIFDDHMKSITDIRVQGDLLLTTSRDGLIIIRYLSDPSDIILSIYAHNSSPNIDGGILCAQFVHSGSKILSVGYDASVISWELEEDIQFEYELNQIECPLNINYLNGLSEVMIDEDNLLTFDEKTKTEIINKEKDKFQPTLHEINNELKELRIKYDNVSEKVQNASELEKLDSKQLIVDNKQYEILLNENKKEIDNVGEEIKYENIGKQLIMRRIKEQCWDGMAEKLQIVKGIKSTETVTTFPILSHNKNDLLLIKKLQFLRKMNIIEQEWSTKTQDRVRIEFDITHSVNDKSIKYIWDINELSKEQKQREKEVTKNNLSSDSNKNDKDKKDKKDKNNKNDKKDKNKKNDKKDKNKKGDGNDDDNRIKFEVSEQLKNLLYHPMKLYTNYSKRIQINLLNLRIRELKSSFNREIDIIFKLKTAEVERINEMALEITDIQKELQLNDEVFICKLDDDENKDRIFNVNDNEIKVEKVLTEFELKKLTEKELERKKLEKNANNNLTERALYDMMNNTLDSKDEVERLEDTLKKPEFMDNIDESQWTEEQKSEIAQYEEKKEALIKAKEVRKKLLRTRLKSLKNDVFDICKNFDIKLKLLYDIRLAVMEDIYVHELMLIHLGNDIIEYEQHKKRIYNMNIELIRLKEDKEKADNTYNQFNSKLEESKKKLDDLHSADKYLEKTFKKEMATFSGDYFDYLFKLFRGRKAIPPKHGGHNLNKPSMSIPFERKTSYSTNDSNSDIFKYKNKSELNIIDHLKEENEEIFDDEIFENEDKSELLINPYFESLTIESTDILLSNLTKPIDLSCNVWNRFLELRKLKILRDKEISNLSHQIASMQAEVNALETNQRIILESISEIDRGRELLTDRSNKYALDCELFFCLEQGSVEVEESPIVTDMRQSVMCNRNVIENLNKIILNAGNEQIQRLVEIKKFRRGINLLNWRAKILDLEYRYYTLLTTEYQLRRVTKKDQEIIKIGGHNNKQKNEVTSLERKLDFNKNTINTKIKEKKKLLKKYKNRCCELNKSNNDLIKQINKLQTDVNSKQQILNIRATISVKDEKKQSIQKKMDAVVTRRKLVDLVGAQSEEIEFLRNELDRLRRRTFPSFSIADSH